MNIKLLLVGPCESGKSCLANFLADSEIEPDEYYRPTKGCRIQKFKVQTSVEPVDVELWDVSGDKQYRECWPAIMSNTDGVMICFDGDKEVDNDELMFWFKNIIKPSGVKSAQGILIANHYAEGDGLGRPSIEIAGSLSKAKLIHIDVNDDPEEAHKDFAAFVEKVSQYSRERRDKEERSIMN